MRFAALTALVLPLTGVVACSLKWEAGADVDGDGYTLFQGDCDDSDPDVNPGQVEVWYDGIDQNCDGADDFDADGDGFTVDEECDDSDAAAFPSDTPEVWYDCVDDNCDNNDGDQDGDGFVPDDYAAACPEWEALNPGAQAGDCWDTPELIPSAFSAINGFGQPAAIDVHPGAEDAPYDGVDAACDGDALEFDADGDGHASAAWPDRDLQSGDDCDDADAAVNPDAAETCLTEGVDDDCDGSTVGIDAEACDDLFVDDDGDGFGGQAGQCRCEAGGGYVVADSSDCDDSDAAIHPDAEEVCDGVDNDCDGDVDADDADAVDLETRYPDADGDGYGDGSRPTSVCPDDPSFVEDDSDCHDDDAAAYPGSHETETPLDGIDTDCDGDDFCTDLNCDGRPDLVYTSYYSGNSYVTQAQIFFHTGGSPAFTNGGSDEDLVDGYGVYDVEAADLDGDGYLDLVLANHRGGGSSNAFEINSYVYWGSAAGYGGSSGSSDRMALPTQGARAVLLEDIDGDGALDVVFAGHVKNGNNYAAYSYIYWGSSVSLRLASDVTDLLTPGALAVASGDLDGDGYTDLVFADSYSNSDGFETSSYIYWGGEDATDYFDSQGRTGIPTQGANDVVVDDLDGDGFLDIVFANRQSNSTYAVDSEIHWGDGTRGGFQSPTTTALSTTGARELLIRDLDADGLLDVLVAQYWDGSGPNGYSRLFMQTSSRGFTMTELNVPGGRRPAVADVDADGADDIIWPLERDPSDSTSYDRSFIFLGDPSNLGVYSASDRQSLLDTDGATGVVVWDFDEDGLLDLCFAEGWDALDSEASESTCYLGRSSGTYSSAATFNLDTVNPLTAPLVVGPSN